MSKLEFVSVVTICVFQFCHNFKGKKEKHTTVTTVTNVTTVITFTAVINVTTVSQLEFFSLVTI